MYLRAIAEEADDSLEYDDSNDFGDDTALEPADLMARILAAPEDAMPESTLGAAEDLEYSQEVAPPANAGEQAPEQPLGRGKQRKTANTLYKNFGMH